MSRDYKFHRPTCPHCACTVGTVVMGDPSFLIDKCPHCGQIFVARSFEGKIQTYPANKYQIEEYYSLNTNPAIISNEDSNKTQIEFK